METWLAIPLRSFKDGKTRLGGALDQAERRTLARRMLEHMLSVALPVIGAKRTFVVTGDPEVTRFTSASGAQVLEENPVLGMNAAAALAAACLLDPPDGNRRLLILPGDLPLLHFDDLQALLSAADAGASLVLAPDRKESGTNALLIERPARFRFAFGEGSFAAHLRQAEAAGLSVAVVRRRGLALDIDTADDLRELRLEMQTQERVKPHLGAEPW